MTRRAMRDDLDRHRAGKTRPAVQFATELRPAFPKTHSWWSWPRSETLPRATRMAKARETAKPTILRAPR
jgi:hypothetical protein